MKEAVNLENINNSTKMFMDDGCFILQAHRFGETDELHLCKLLHWACVPKNAKVIDFGSGTGVMGHFWTKMRPDIEFCMVNISQFQLDSMEPIGIQHRCSMEEVPEPDDKFDVAICCFSIGHADMDEAIAEMARVVKPNGCVFIYDMARKFGTNHWLHKISYEVHERDHIENIAKKHNLELDFYMEPNEIRNVLRDKIGENYDHIFEGVVPAVWRWVKRAK